MEIAYLIHAYNNPRQLLRLVDALQSPTFAFFVHIDKNVKIEPFRKALGESKANITFIEREYSYWGSIGFVRSQLNGISQALNDGKRYDHIIFLSGQDYPIKQSRLIEEFLSDNSDKCFVKHMSLPNKCWGEDGGMYRIRNYHYQQFKNRTTVKVVNRCLKYLKFILPKRDFPQCLKMPYGGEAWISLNRDSAQYIMAFVEEHPDYVNFHKYSYCPEEMFLHTILLNSDDDQIRSSIVNSMLTYIDWKSTKAPRPAIMGSSDFGALIRADNLFARKFDINIDSKILDMIDERILKSEIP